MAQAAAEGRAVVVDDEIEPLAGQLGRPAVLVVQQDAVVRQTEGLTAQHFAGYDGGADDALHPVGEARCKQRIARADVQDRFAAQIETVEIAFDAQLIGRGGHGAPVAPFVGIGDAWLQFLAAIERQVCETLGVKRVKRGAIDALGKNHRMSPASRGKVVLR